MEASRVQRLSADAARHAPRVLRVGCVGVLGAVLLLVGYALLLLPFTPTVDKLLAARDDKPSVLLAADGSLLATFRRTQREWVPLARIPTHVVDALIATEDHRFWQHPGVDWRRSLSAVAHSLAGDPQGGSTITQQSCQSSAIADRMLNPRMLPHDTQRRDGSSGSAASQAGPGQLRPFKSPSRFGWLEELPPVSDLERADSLELADV